MNLNFIYILLGVLVALAIVGGVVMTALFGASADDVQVVEIAPTPVPTSTPVPPEPDVGVYISGAVVNPGVYIMYEGSRLASVLLLAGGATENADLSAINLAVVVQDEDHWHIPRVGEEVPAGAQASNGDTSNGRSANGNAAASSAQVGQDSDGKVNLNSADVTLLKTLPSIGEVRAQAIVSYREANGDFASIDALLEVDGVGVGIVENIRHLVTVE